MATNLREYQNQQEVQRKADLEKYLIDSIKEIFQHNDIRAAAFVAIDSEGKAFSEWDTGAIVPMWAFSEMVGTILSTDLAESEVEEDWRPPLRPPIKK